ncbi:uncharacterized protein [Ptychodera flava]|uniref:uncharacterized protein n=1 Tax=Ptychodera flava TaxID=63121 RepID=UPI00396A3EF3
MAFNNRDDESTNFDVLYRKAPGKNTTHADERPDLNAADDLAAIVPIPCNNNYFDDAKNGITQQKEINITCAKQTDDTDDGDQVTNEQDDNSMHASHSRCNGREDKHEQGNAERQKRLHTKKCCSVQ